MFKVKKIFRQKIQYCFENYILTPLDTYNGLSQVDCIKPEGMLIRAGIHKMLVEKQTGKTDQTASLEAVCFGSASLSRRLVFEILEHLLYSLGNLL